MGFSANQARFLSLTSRQVDLEYRMQQICHRRLRLASELENIASEYNNDLSDRKLFTMNNSLGISAITSSGLNGLGYNAYFDNSGTNTLLSTTDATAYGQIDTALGDGVTTTASNYSERLETAIRAGIINLARPSDAYTQQEVSDLSGYEQVDWRSLPEIADELYKANDVSAETKYEAAIEKINSQDKKLQLEQSQIEVEHKAIITQKDAVKSVITKNIESSFKTFS